MASGDSVDYDAIEWSSKILVGLFLVAIAVINIILLIMLLVKGFIVRSPRWYIVSSLAFCNLLFALFPLVIQEMSFHEDTVAELDCEKTTLAGVYVALHSFVTCFSLMVLCAELFARDTIKSTFGNPLLSGVVLAGVPWILGLIVILPLILAGFDMDTCRYDEGDIEETLTRFRALQCVAVIAPACLAFIISLITKAITFKPIPDVYNSAGESSETQNAGAVMQPQQGTNQGTHYDAHDPDGKGSHSHQNYEVSNTAFKGQQSPYHPQHQQYYNPQSVTVPYAGMQYLATSELRQNSEKEKNVLLGLSCLFAVLFLPNAIFLLAYVLNTDLEVKRSLGPIAQYTLSLGLMYWQYLWSVISPLVWMVVLLGKNNR